MKKLLTLFSVLGFSSIATLNVVACNLGELGDGNTNQDEEIPEEDGFKSLDIAHESYDYEYSNKQQYLEASKYYLEYAAKSYESIDMARKDTNGDYTNISIDAMLEFPILIVPAGHVWMYFSIWYATEAQWDLLKVDEYNGNWKMDEINLETITKDDFNKTWYLERIYALSTFKQYYGGAATDITSSSGWCVYGLGFDKMALKLFDLWDTKDPDGTNSAYNHDREQLQKLVTHWETRINLVDRIYDKFGEILAEFDQNN